MGRRHWHFWSTGDFSGLASYMLLLVCMPLEVRAWESLSLPAPSSKTVATALAGAFALNACLVERYLSRKTPADVQLRRGWRLARFLLGGAPLVGWWVLGCWRYLLDRRPEWAFRPQTRQRSRPIRRIWPRWVPSATGAPLWARWLQSWISWFWLVLGNVLLLLIASHWLATAPIDPLRRQDAILGTTALLHAFGLAAMAQHQWLRARRLGAFGWRRAAMLALSLCWLLPLPGVFLGVALSLSIELEGPRAQTLTWKAFAGTSSDDLIRLLDRSESASDLAPGHTTRREVNEVEDWYGLRLWNSVSVEATGEQRELTAAYRLKTLLLACDGIGLGWVASWVAAQSGWRQSLDGPLLAMAAGLFALAGLGMAWAAFDLARSKIRRTSENVQHHRTGFYLALVLISLLVGIFLGVCFQRGFLRDAGGLLALAMLLYLVGGLVVSNPLLRASSLGSDLLLWSVLFLALLAMGYAMALDTSQTIGRASARICLLFAGFLPLWHGLFAIGFGPRILHPFSLRESLRWRAAGSARFLLAATAVAPFGGLAVPYWISLRQNRWHHHQRQWTPDSPTESRIPVPGYPWDFARLDLR